MFVLKCREEKQKVVRKLYSSKVQIPEKSKKEFFGILGSSVFLLLHHISIVKLTVGMVYIW